jgi:hypothetical protein
VAKSHPMTFFIISEQTPVGIGLFENAFLPKKTRSHNDLITRLLLHLEKIHLT